MLALQVSKLDVENGEGSLTKLWLRKQHVKNLVHRSELDTLTHLCSSQFWLGHGILCGADSAVLYKK